MDLLGSSWLAGCAVAPTIAALSVWFVFIINCYRNRWRNVDLFILVIAVQQVLGAFAIFAFAVVNVVRSRNESACTLVAWALTALRVYQLTTLTSLAIDRYLVLRWPYKYRFTVRSNQIKYHVVVLAIIAALVGVAGLFTRASSHQLHERLAAAGADSAAFYCSMHPAAWDVRYNMFTLGLFAFLTLVTLLCLMCAESRRVCSPKRMRPQSRMSSLGDLVGMEQPNDVTKSTTGSYRSLYGCSAHATLATENIAKKIFVEQLRTLDLRWASVLAVIGLTYAVNHGPAMVSVANNKTRYQAEHTIVVIGVMARHACDAHHRSNATGVGSLLPIANLFART